MIIGSVRTMLLAAAVLVNACSSDHTPLEPLVGTLEVQVLDEPVVAQLNAWNALSFTVRLRLHNSSSAQSLRWGGCGWLALRSIEGDYLWSPACALNVPPNHGSTVLAAGETRVVEETIFIGTTWAPWAAAVIDRDVRFRAAFGVSRPRSLARLVGEQPGQSESNVFRVTLDH